LPAQVDNSLGKLLRPLLHFLWIHRFSEYRSYKLLRRVSFQSAICNLQSEIVETLP